MARRTSSRDFSRQDEAADVRACEAGQAAGVLPELKSPEFEGLLIQKEPDAGVKILHDLTLSGTKSTLVPHLSVSSLKDVEEQHKAALDAELKEKRAELLSLKKELWERQTAIAALRKEHAGLAPRKAAPSSGDVMRRERDLAKRESALREREESLSKRERESARREKHHAQGELTGMEETEMLLSRRAEEFTRRCDGLQLLMEMRESDLKRLDAEHC